MLGDGPGGDEHGWDWSVINGDGEKRMVPGYMLEPELKMC